jgi:hypothetical protein
MTKYTENAGQSRGTAGREQPTVEAPQKKEPWWRKDPQGKESSLDHSNMNPDNLKSNDL